MSKAMPKPSVIGKPGGSTDGARAYPSRPSFCLGTANTCIEYQGRNPPALAGERVSRPLRGEACLSTGTSIL